MGAALSIFVILSVSIFIVRVAAVALRITGLPDDSARFQALSAFTGTGFTTSETEMVVNYPIRRRIVSLLMIIGNMGLMSVFATLVVSLVHTEGDVGAVVAQLAWLLAGLALLWFLMLNKTADRSLCTFIGKILRVTTFLGQRRFQRLLQIGDGYSICEHPLASHWMDENGQLVDAEFAALELSVLAIRSPRGDVSIRDRQSGPVDAGDTVVLFGRDAGHEELGRSSRRAEPEVSVRD